MNSTDVKLLEVYYKFFSEKNKSLKEFVETASRSFVQTGQIDKSVFDSFIESIELTDDIKSKKLQLIQLQLELDELNTKLAKFKNTGKPKTASKTVTGDGCSNSGRSYRAGC